MTDLFGRQLAERLHAHPLPDEIPDLGIQSVRLAERIRRRRIGAVVVVLAVLLMIPVAGLWRVHLCSLSAWVAKKSSQSS